MAACGNGTITTDSSVNTPTANPPAGTYAATQSVYLFCATSGAEIYYTLDGSMPSRNSEPYAGVPITVSKTLRLRAIAVKESWTNSSVLTADYTITTSDSSVNTPTANPPAGTYAAAQSVYLSCATAGAEIYYTLDGSTPSANSTPWNGLPITVNANMTIRAIAIKAGWTNSGVLTADYTITTSINPNPDPGGGNKPQKVTLEDNYQYGSNYQSGKVNGLRWDRMVNTDAFAAGDKWQIEFEFTVSRDLEEDLECTIVWQPDGTPSYWELVSYIANMGPSSKQPDQNAFDNIQHGPYTPPAGSVGYKAGTTHTKTVELEIRATTKQNSVPVGSAPRNATHLVFHTKGIGNVSVAGSGAKGPVEIDFTKLIVTKL